MSKKIRVKKGNKNTIKQAMNKIFMRDVAIVQLNNNPIELIDLQTMKINRRPATVMKRAIMEERYRWSVGLLAFCTESNGKRKMVIEVLNMGSANYHRDIADVLIDNHREMLIECDKIMTVESVGLIAAPYYKVEFQNTAGIMTLFESMGAYEQTINKMITEQNKELAQ